MYSTDTSFSSSQTVTEPKRGLMYWMLVTLVFVYPVWPVFIEKKIGPLPSLTPQKILLYALIGLCLIQLAFSKDFGKKFRDNIVANTDIFGPIAILLLIKFVSCVFGISPFYSLPIFYYETLTTLGVLFVVICLVQRADDIRPVINAMLLAALAIGLFSVIEAVAGKNILEPFINKENFSLALLDKEREGARRLQGVFASPMQLAEFSALMIPFIIFAYKTTEKSILKYSYVFCIGLMLFAIYASRTRSALGVVAISFCVWGFVWLRSFLANQKSNPVVRCIVGFYGSIALIAIVVGCLWMIYSLVSGYSIAQTLGIAEKAQTLYAGGKDARFVQFEMALPHIFSNPLLGLGLGVGGVKVGYVGTNGIYTIDSQMLLNALDSGLPALVLTTYIFVYCALQGRRLSLLCRDKYHAGFMNAFSLAIGCVIFFTIISPVYDFFTQAFVLIGCLVVLKTRYKKFGNVAQ